MKTLIFTLLVAVASIANGATIDYTIDFETDDGGMVLVHGQDISSPDEFGTVVSLSSSGPNEGLAIFDTDLPTGQPVDDDLLVGLGNALILQDNRRPTQTVSGIFDVPDDSDEDGGRMTFDFVNPVSPESIDLLDIDTAVLALVTLTDGGGLTRTYRAPQNWTDDVAYSTLDLTLAANQPGPGGATAIFAQEAGFDLADTRQLTIDWIGSGAVDNLKFSAAVIPEPSSILAMATGILLIAMRRRKRG